MAKTFMYDPNNIRDVTMDLRIEDPKDPWIQIASRYWSIACLDKDEAEQLYDIIGGLAPDRLNEFKEVLLDMIEEMEKPIE